MSMDNFTTFNIPHRLTKLVHCRRILNCEKTFKIMSEIKIYNKYLEFYCEQVLNWFKKRFEFVFFFSISAPHKKIIRDPTGTYSSGAS